MTTEELAEEAFDGAARVQAFIAGILAINNNQATKTYHDMAQRVADLNFEIMQRSHIFNANEITKRNLETVKDSAQ